MEWTWEQWVNWEENRCALWQRQRALPHYSPNCTLSLPFPPIIFFPSCKWEAGLKINFGLLRAGVGHVQLVCFRFNSTWHQSHHIQYSTSLTWAQLSTTTSHLHNSATLTAVPSTVNQVSETSYQRSYTFGATPRVVFLTHTYEGFLTAKKNERRRTQTL
jgi:hypothetical protein